MIGKLLRNVRDGRVQKLLAATTAMSVPAQCRASMARKATLGRSAHMVKAL